MKHHPAEHSALRMALSIHPCHGSRDDSRNRPGCGSCRNGLIFPWKRQYVPSKGWAEMIKKVYEIDPLLCPKCAGRMKVISFIQDYAVIDKIINHLKLSFIAERPRPRLPKRNS